MKQTEEVNAIFNQLTKEIKELEKGLHRSIKLVYLVKVAKERDA